MSYVPILVWIVRFAFPVAVFWYLWRSKSGRPVIPSWRAGNKRIYQRSYMLCYKPTGNIRPDPAVEAQLMRLETMEELSKTIPSIRKALSKAKRKSETIQAKNPTSACMVESLVNYLAYNAPEKRQFLSEVPSQFASGSTQRQRSTLSDGTGRPNHSLSSQPEEDVVARSNDEAVRILQGALVFKKVSVADRLYKQLTEAEIDIREAAYSLMVQIAVAAKDLTAATDYLLKMESAGIKPPFTLVQDAMAIYSETKKADSKENLDSGNLKWDGDNAGKPLNVIESGRAFPISSLSPDAQEFIPGNSYGDGSLLRARGVRCGMQGHSD